MLVDRLGLNRAGIRLLRVLSLLELWLKLSLFLRSSSSLTSSLETEKNVNNAISDLQISRSSDKKNIDYSASSHSLPVQQMYESQIRRYPTRDSPVVDR